MDRETKKLVEHVIALAWPSKIEKMYHSWILRVNEGVSKRANSVFTVGEMPKTEHWLKEIESFYEKHSVKSNFYIAESSPPELEHILIAANYEKINDMYLLYHESERVVNEIERMSKLVATYETEVSDEWIDLFLQLEGHEESKRTEYASIFENIKIPKMFLSLSLNERIVALGTIAVKDHWGYISNVVVDQQFRRQGFGSQVIRELAKWSLNNETEYIFLQVLKSNHAGLKLYEHLGFATLSESHFRIKNN